MKAMILAAGFGTRLRPLTDVKPKALIPVVNKPIIHRVIEYLTMFDVSQIVVNTHHHFQKILDYLDKGRPFGLEIDVRVEPGILGTGGGIKNTSDFWDSDPFIVINGDILTSIDLAPACERHRKSGALVTLVLHDCGPFNQLLIDKNLNIIDIAHKSGPDRLAFTGIHIMDPALLAYIPEGKFSNIIDCYRQLIQSGNSIRAYLAEGHYWYDIGTVSGYIMANKALLDEKSFSIGFECHIDPSVTLGEWAVLGEKTCLEKGVEVRRSILWNNVRVKEGTKIIDSIVTSSKEVDRDLIGETY